MKFLNTILPNSVYLCKDKYWTIIIFDLFGRNLFFKLILCPHIRHILESDIVISEKKPGPRFTNIKTQQSYSLTGSFPMKNYDSGENRDSRA